jgi:hypothetical protein
MTNRWTTLALLLSLMPFGFARAEMRTVWQIGTFDHSPLEFSSEPQDQITFEIGKSDPQKQWSSFQGVGHPYRILFSLDSPRGLYSLKIAALIVQPRVPALQVDINGHSGMFFLHPWLSYFPGDVESSYHPNNSQADLVIEIPPAFLKTGQNVISLTCVDDPPSAQAEGNASSIAYDALTLEQDAAQSYENNKIRADVQPTVFYRQTAGGLLETVDAFVRFNGPVPEGRAELRMRDKQL